MFQSSSLIIILLLLAACTPSVIEPGLSDQTAYPLPASPQEKETIIPEAYPPLTPVTPPLLPDMGPTELPTPTNVPPPTLVPTPLVTPIPTTLPPIIPEIADIKEQPFWIYYWQDNEIWRVDDRGQNHEMLLDTYASLGLYLTANPYLETLIHTYQSQRVKVSPDGQTLALVVADQPRLVQKGVSVTFSIYLYDIKTGDLKFLSQGASPLWSPDSQRIAFQGGLSPNGQASDGGLWIADLEADQIYQLIAGDPANSELYVAYWDWSPDGQQIAYRYSEGRIGKTELWIVNLNNPLSPLLAPNIPADIYHNCFSWTPDSQGFLCRIQDATGQKRSGDLWTISIQTGEQKQLTEGLDNAGGSWSPDGKWLALNAIRLYEREEGAYDIWLASSDGSKLLRATSAPPQDILVDWSPDGTRLVLRRDNVGLVTLSLKTGNIIPLDVNLPEETGASYNYAVGEANES